MRDGRTNDKQLKIELVSQWKLETESRNLKQEIVSFRCRVGIRI